MMFAGRQLLIATKHGKERVMAPLLEQALGVTCYATKDFDTDQFGTFTGEVERSDDPVAAARKKCLYATDLYGGDLAVANEGSFGMHPVAFFSYADEEIVLLKDRTNDLEIIAWTVSMNTNFGGAEVRTEQQLIEFARRHYFPSHGLIIRAAKGDTKNIIKGITNEEVLTRQFRQFAVQNGSAFVETDMRAMYNPTRMGVIESVTQRLIEKVTSICPNCACPGFGIIQAMSGLPCRRCGLPTRSTQTYLYRCMRCKYQKTQQVIDHESPEFCDHCNP